MSFRIGDVPSRLEFKEDILKKILSLKVSGVENGCNKNCKYLYKCRGCYIRALNVNKENKILCNWIRNNDCIELLLLM